jgi:hypothetical protein
MPTTWLSCGDEQGGGGKQQPFECFQPVTDLIE